MPYSGDPTGVARDAIRVLVGDLSTAASGEYLGDEAYDFIIAQASNVYVRAQIAATSIAAKFTGAAASASGTGYVEKSVGDLKIKKADAAQLASQYRSLASEYGKKAALGISPYAGGISASDKAANAADTDNIAPAFALKLMDNANANDFAPGSVST